MDLFGPLKTSLSTLYDYWWLYLPALLVVGTFNSWLFYRTQQYLLSLRWVVLEVKPPPDVQKSPKIAENIYSALHASYLPVKWKRRFFKGEVPNWYSLEVVSNGGDMNFYVRVKEDTRMLAEHAIFSQYPDAEIKIVPDYVNQLPPNLPTPEYDMFGADLIFTKEDAYPIKTYPFFEEESGKDEFKRTDPLAVLAEVLGALEPGEYIWLQFVIRPTGDAWAKAAQAAINKIIGKEAKAKAGLVGGLLDLTLGQVPTGIASKGAEEEKKQEFNVQKLTPGQRFTLEQVENKVAKYGFKTSIRFIYTARKEMFHRSHIASTIGMFKQLYSNNLNTFKPDGKTMTVAKGFFHHIFPSGEGLFKVQHEFKRKRKIFRRYKQRAFHKKLMILNTEELATLWHLPGIGVKAPGFPRVEAKKGQPPAGLPI